MREILLLIFFAVIAFVFFVITLIRGYRTKSKKIFIISAFCFVLTMCLGIGSVYLFVSKSVNELIEAFKPRTGNEIYAGLFKKPSENCVTIENFKDQVVPRLDCCIWLEFKTCPKELSRIILTDSFEMSKYSSLDTSAYIPDYSPRPDWWTPNILADTIIVMRKFNFENPNRHKILIFSNDSSHVYYCDMAD
jgi:hypothetical protein